MMIAWQDLFGAVLEGEYERAKQLLTRLDTPKAVAWLACALSQMEPKTARPFLEYLACPDDEPAAELT